MIIKGQFQGGGFDAFEISITEHLNAFIDFQNLNGIPVYSESGDYMYGFSPDSEFYVNKEEGIEIDVIVNEIEIKKDGHCILICRPSLSSLSKVQKYLKKEFPEFLTK